MLDQLFPNVDWEKMWEATYETIYMTARCNSCYVCSRISNRDCVIFNKSESIMGK